MLALDLGVFHRKAHEVRVKEAAGWSVLWIALALGFAGLVFWQFGTQTGQEWLTRYVIEKALSVDNLFVFYVIFQVMRVPNQVQHRILFWGIIGALVLRAAMVFGGTLLLQTVHWVIYLFGAVLIVSGIRMFRRHEEDEDPRDSRIYRWLTRVIPTTRDLHGAQLFAREGGRLLATPLFLVLVLVELSDVVFAIDSILAIFAITEDPFIVMTSNVFAVLGLRSLYFVLAGLTKRFDYLQPGLAMVLVFVGVKMMIAEWIHIPVLVSLGVIALLLGGSVVASIVQERVRRSASSRPNEPTTTS